MMATPIARFLTRFGATEADDAIPLPEMPSFVASFEPEPAPDIETLIAEARAEGVAEGEAAGETTTQAQLAQQQAGFQKELDAARAAWCAEQSGQLAAALATGLETLEGRMCRAAADILRPIVADALRERAIEALAEAVSSIGRDAQAPALRLSGPSDLVEGLAHRLDDRAGIELCVDDGMADISVIVGQTVIESRLAAWAERLRGDLE